MRIAYIMGLCLSDVTVWENRGELYFVLNTSKECMINLFRKTFENIADNIYISKSSGFGVKKNSIKIYARIKQRNKWYNILKQILEIKNDYHKMYNMINSKDDALNLFLGLFDGDGSITILKSGFITIRITSIDFEKLKVVKDVLERFGYKAYITKDGKTGLTCKQKYSLRIHKEHQRFFVELIAKRSLHV